MIDVYVAYNPQDGHFLGFTSRITIWWGGPTKERIAEINWEFPINGNWIFRRTGPHMETLVKWQFCGRHDKTIKP